MPWSKRYLLASSFSAPGVSCSIVQWKTSVALTQESRSSNADLTSRKLQSRIQKDRHRGKTEMEQLFLRLFPLKLTANMFWKCGGWKIKFSFWDLTYSEAMLDSGSVCGLWIFDIFTTNLEKIQFAYIKTTQHAVSDGSCQSWKHQPFNMVPPMLPPPPICINLLYL